MKQNQKITRLAYLSGHVDALDVFDKWSKEQTLGYFGNSHLSEFYDVCARLGFEAYVITTLPGATTKHRRENILIENHPMPTQVSGVLYHLANVWWLVSLLPGILRFKPDVLIVTAGTNYWFILAFLKWRGIVIIPVLTVTLWPKFSPVRTSWRLLFRLNKLFFALCAKAIIVASDEIATQVRNFTAGKEIPIVTFLPVYPREQFSMFCPAQFHARPFNVFFAGRIETNKGVYDILAMAQWLERSEPNTFRFDICGEGSELESLRKRIVHLGLAACITCHGFCERPQMSQLLDGSSVVIVPTTTDFEEGFNMVCAEAILAGRPLITSSVCPALNYVRDAAIEVPPDNVHEYCQAILSLAHDEELFERKRLACNSAQEQFYNQTNSWGARLTTVLTSLYT